MNKGLFSTQINTAWNILDYVELAAERVYFPSYSEKAATFRGLNYLDTWRLCIQKQYYHFQLIDNSLIQFEAESYAPLKLRYVFYECLIKSISYLDFLVSYDLNHREVGDSFREEYENYLITCRVKDTFTPIRYDFTPDLYTEGRHPASHIHFGHQNEIRIGTKYILKPLSFLLLILRQHYPNAWNILIQNKEAKNWCKNVRKNLESIEDIYWNVLDEWEMILT